MSGSACSMPPRVSSENTTPNPNVSLAALRSQTVISCAELSCLVSAEKYSPPGPPPTTAILIYRPFQARTVLKLLLFAIGWLTAWGLGGLSGLGFLVEPGQP